MTTDLLAFQRTIIEQVLEDDCLCVLAPGLGLHQIVSVLLRLQDVRLQDPEQRGAVLIIGASPWQRTAIRQELLRIHPEAERTRPTGLADDDPLPPLPAEVTADIATAERLRLYQTCSSMFVTTRILVVDLLSGRLAPSDIAGICVLNAHRVTDSSGEGFVVRLYRYGNSTGFVRGFSDLPSSFASEFGKAEKIMKALHAKRLHLWPRFQVAVQEDLEKRPPELVEISLPCDAGAALVYEALTDLIDSCIKELRKLEKLDTTDLTPSQGLSSAFDETIRRQLAPIWHTVSPKTRQIVADLKTLRSLANLLNKLDPVTFLNYLDTLRVTEGTRCAWLFHSAAHTVFEAAKARVYRLAMPGEGAASQGKKRKAPSTSAAAAAAASGSTMPPTAPSLEPILDELPKWHALIEILDEARTDRAAVAAEAAKTRASSSSLEPPPIVVFCQDEYTCAQLREVAGPDGPGGFMRRVYREYLQYKMDSGLSGGKKKSASGDVAESSSMAAAIAPRMMGGYLPGEEAALFKEARGMGATKTAQARGGGAAGRGKGRGRGGGSTKAALKTATAALAGASKGASGSGGGSKKAAQPLHAAELVAEEGEEGGKEPGTAAAAKAPEPSLADPLDVQFIALDTQGPLPLWQYSPNYVIVYDPDVALTRSLEIFKAQRRGVPLRVYLLRYEDSPEMDKYQAAVVRERTAFEGLIRAKGIMAPVIAAAAQAGPGRELAPPPVGGGQELGIAPGAAGNAITRRAGGRLPGRTERLKVIVDVREFMSPLPAVLHSKGLQLVPLTLEVGDYVLSPEICIERKSLSDLRGSLISGRLYQQAEAMCKHYKTAILLVEFEGDRAFAFQGVGELGDDIQANSMMSRLILLCLHHPRLRLVWSRSLHATADIFKQLKANHEEPDPITAATVGVSGEDAGQGGESVVNAAAIDVLRRLPGVSDSNYRALMREAGSLAGLAAMDFEKLSSIMGGDAPARKLHEFLVQECRALFKAL